MISGLNLGPLTREHHNRLDMQKFIQGNICGKMGRDEPDPKGRREERKERRTFGWKLPRLPCNQGKCIENFRESSSQNQPVSSVKSLSHVRLFAIPWTVACQASLFITNSRSLLKLMSIESVMPSSHLILYHPLLLPPSIFPSIRVFSIESVLRTRRPKYWSFSFNPSNEYSGLISFRMDWLDLLAVQGTLKSILQHHSSKASILWHSAFFIFQLAHPPMTTGKTIALTRQNFFGKVMSLLFNMPSRLVIAFLPRSKRLLISTISH